MRDLQPRKLICCVAWLALTAVVHGQGFKFLEVKVVDPDGKPMADVPVEIAIDNMKFPMPTDDKGIVSVNIPSGGGTELTLSVSHEGYSGVQARWAKGNKIPDAFTIPLKRGTTIGGIVHDEAGRPVEGVKVEAVITAFNDFDMSWGNGELRPKIPRELGKTGQDGRWEFGAAPEVDASLVMRFSHPDYVSDSGFSYRGGTWKELLSGNKVVVMRQGMVIAGRVTDQNQQPIAGAKVSIGHRHVSNRIVETTDEEGEYTIPNRQAGSVALTVVAAGYAPEQRTVAVSKDMPPADFQLGPGNRIRLKVVGTDGTPLAGVRVIPDEWRGTQTLDELETSTDDQGYWEWVEAPADEVKYGFYRRGMMGLEKKLVPESDIQTIEMHPAVIVNGNVVDKETGNPIETFRYTNGVWWEPTYQSYVLQSMNVESGKSGKFRFQMEDACHKFCVRVEADGYKPLVSRDIYPDEGEIEITFELEKGQGPQGVVLTPVGAPAEGATVVLGDEEQPAQMRDGVLEDFSIARMMTGADGKYKLPIPNGQFVLIALHETGWTELENPDEKAAAQLTLQPWSIVKGTVWEGDQRVSQGQVVMYFETPLVNSRTLQSWSHYGTTDDEGNFEFRRVRGGELKLHRQIRYADTGESSMPAYTHGIAVQVVPGGAAEVKIGGEGRRVMGELTVAEKDRELIDWNFGLVQLNRPQKASSESAEDVSYAAPVKPDGTFEIVDVLPGNYAVKVSVYAKDYRSAGNWQPIATPHESCEVPDGDRAKAVDIGRFTVELVKPQD